MKVHSSGGIIIKIIDGKRYIVLTNQTDTNDGNNEYWSFPKGHIKQGEDPLTTAYREIYEEVGLKDTDLELIYMLGEYERESITPIGKIKKKITLFLFITKETNIRSNDTNNLQPKWFPLEEVPGKLGNAGDVHFFRKIKDKLISNFKFLR